MLLKTFLKLFPDVKPLGVPSVSQCHIPDRPLQLSTLTCVRALQATCKILNIPRINTLESTLHWSDNPHTLKSYKEKILTEYFAPLPISCFKLSCASDYLKNFYLFQAALTQTTTASSLYFNACYSII